VITTPLIILCVLAAVGTYAGTRWFLRYAEHGNITDVPNDRSSHTHPKPTGGGVGFVSVSLLTLLIYAAYSGYLSDQALLIIVVILAVMATIGWMDDKYNLSQVLRYGAQSAAAVAVILFISNLETFHLPFLGVMELGIISYIFAFVWITGTPNIYNFMDGVDGIASVQAIGATTGWMVLAYSWGQPELLALNLIILISILVFLKFNWAPSSIFMGDVGSLFLGFLFAIMPFYAAYLPGSPEIGILIWVAAIMLWPFLFDGAYTIFRRMKRGENVFKPHRSHLYQRLYEQGWPHQKIASLYGLFSLIALVCAIFYVTNSELARLSIILLLLAGSFGFASVVKNIEQNDS